MYTTETIGAAVAEHIKQKFGEKRGSKAAAAAALNITPVEISEAIYQRRAPSYRLLASMGLQKITAYVPKEQK